MEALTQDRIKFLLSTTKQRGVYEADIQSHVDSGNIACNFSELEYYKGKDVAAVRNSINGNLEKHSKENDWPKMTVVFDKGEPATKDKTLWEVILVNLDALAAASDTSVDEDTEVEDAA